MFKAKVAAVAIATMALAPGVAIMAAGDVHAQTRGDELRYLEVLAEEGISSGNGPAGMLRLGYVVCDFLDQGFDEMTVASMVYDQNPIDSGGAGYIVGAAQGALCPWTIDGPVV